jgi:hypothetical protein
MCLTYASVHDGIDEVANLKNMNMSILLRDVAASNFGPVTENADCLANDLKSKGYSAYIIECCFQASLKLSGAFTF